MMSGRAGLSDAVKATKLGAFHFLEKPLTPEGVLLALRSALELRQARREARTLREDLGAHRRDGRREPGDAAGARDDRARGADGCARAAHGRVGHGQGARGGGDPPRRARGATGPSCA